MPTGPKGQKRPADVIGNAVKVMRIATGEDEDETPDDGKDAAAKKLGAKGGKKRAANLSPERRAEIARNAAAKRWGKAD
ncbi:MAG: RNA-binding protein [Nitratireductor sp.]